MEDQIPKTSDELDDLTAPPAVKSYSVPIPAPPKQPVGPFRGIPGAITLTEEQATAIDKIKAWLKDPLGAREYKLGGYAGTGKTTIIKVLLQELRREYMVIVCAFTGKAVHVLNKKGVWGQTIHSLLYTPIPLPDGSVKFERKTILEADPDLIICDEASMISTELYRDMLSYNRRYLFVGDPGQLEPVGDNPNLMAFPDLVLSKIHRQAESSPIITFANQVRQGGSLRVSKVDGLWIRPKEITSLEFLANDQVICAKNKTRKLFNEKIRLFKKFPPNQIVEGDKLIVLRNNVGYGVFNGMIIFIDKIISDKWDSWTCNVHDEVGKKLPSLPIWKDPFLNPAQEKFDKVPRTVVYCDYGYAITCHKSQGSEWDKVLVWDEWMPPKVWDMKRWRYTAITRTAEQLTYNL